jgi:5-formyltetrahydrofolate cyclo-ligase
MPNLSKDSIRRELRARRNAFEPASRIAAAGHIQTRLLDLDAIRDAKTWFTYVSSGSEVDTHELIHTLLARDDIVAVPRVIGLGEMVAQQIHSFDELRLGEFGILAPPPSESFTGAIDVCVCPGVAFTECGDRLGAGGGYYDRYLAAHRPRIAVALAFEFQVQPELPVDEYDGRMDFIITEQRVIHVGTAL